MTLFDSLQIAKFTGISQDVQRDHRRRGLWEGVGVSQANGRWKYRPGEIVMLAVQQHLVSRRMTVDLGDALEIARHTVGPLWVRLCPQDQADSIGQANMAIKIVVSHGANRPGDAVQVEHYSTLEAARNLRTGSFLVIDVGVLADELRNQLAPMIAETLAARKDAK